MDSQTILRNPEVQDLFERSEDQIIDVNELNRFRHAVRATLEATDVSMPSSSSEADAEATQTAAEVQFATGVIRGAASMVSSRRGAMHV